MSKFNHIFYQRKKEVRSTKDVFKTCIIQVLKTSLRSGGIYNLFCLGQLLNLYYYILDTRTELDLQAKLPRQLEYQAVTCTVQLGDFYKCASPSHTGTTPHTLNICSFGFFCDVTAMLIQCSQNQVLKYSQTFR